MHANVPLVTVDTPELPSSITGLGWYQRLGGIARVANARLDIQQGSFDSQRLLKSNRKRSHASEGRRR